MHTGYSAADFTERELSLLDFVEWKPAREEMSECLRQKANRFNDALCPKCPKLIATNNSGLRVLLRAERLSKTYPSDETLQFGKGKRACNFHRSHDDEDGIVFGSKQGEYCRMHIDIENASADELLPIDSILNVQMLHPCGITVDLKTIELQGSAYRKEVVVLLEPNALLTRVTRGLAAHKDKAMKRSTRFQLHIEVAVNRSAKIVDIAKTVSWRTAPCMKTQLQAAQGTGLEVMKRVPQVVGNGFLLFRSKVVRLRRRVKNTSPSRGMRQRRPPRSKAS